MKTNPCLGVIPGKPARIQEGPHDQRGLPYGAISHSTTATIHNSIRPKNQGRRSVPFMVPARGELVRALRYGKLRKDPCIIGYLLTRWSNGSHAHMPPSIFLLTSEKDSAGANTPPRPVRLLNLKRQGPSPYTVAAGSSSVSGTARRDEVDSPGYAGRCPGDGGYHMDFPGASARRVEADSLATG